MKLCKHDHHFHYTYIHGGRYRFDTSPDPHRCMCGWGLFPDDDGVRCCSASTLHEDLWRRLINAMEKEAKDGILVVANWAPTFPRRTAELVERSRGVAAAALADKLPAVLIGIVSAYFL